MRPLPTKRLLQLVHEFEGDHGQHRPTPALDPTGHWEIGWGHKLQTAYYPASPINRDQADALAIGDYQACAGGVYPLLGDTVADGLSEGQYAALLDFTYNEGIGRFAASTFCARLKAGNLDAAGRELAKWVWGHVDGKPQILEGLVRRRDAELDLWTNG